MSSKYKKSNNREQTRDRKLSKMRKDIRKMKMHSNELRKELSSYKPMIEDMRKHTDLVDMCIVAVMMANIPHFYERGVPLGDLDATQRRIIQMHFDVDKLRMATRSKLDEMNNLFSMARKAVESPALMFEIIGSKVQPAVFELSELVSKYFLTLQEMMEVGGDKLREAAKTNSTFAEVAKFYDIAVAQNEAYKMGLASGGVNEIPEVTDDIDTCTDQVTTDESAECTSSDSSCDSSSSSD